MKRRRTDQVGRRIPAMLQDVFYDRQRLEQWLYSLRVKRQTLIEIAKQREGARQLNLAKVLRLMEEIDVEIQRAMPYKVCDCGEREVDCPLCEGKRWLSTAEAMIRPAE